MSEILEIGDDGQTLAQRLARGCGACAVRSIGRLRSPTDSVELCPLLYFLSKNEFPPKEEAEERLWTGHVNACSKRDPQSQRQIGVWRVSPETAIAMSRVIESNLRDTPTNPISFDKF